MQIKTFIVTSGDIAAEEELNRFLRAKRILSVIRNFSDQHGCQWHFCVEYLDSESFVPQGRFEKGGKVDYREKLDEKEFARFCILRECRKKLALEDAVPAFAIFLDEQLAELAKLEQFSLSDLRKINGIGEKKSLKYGERFLQVWREKNNETSRKPVSANSGDGQSSPGVLESSAPEIRKGGSPEVS